MIPKFRAFLTETKTIHDVLQIDLSRSMVSLKIENASEWYWFKEVVLMQSTGLKDKNGVEVFQGDIVVIEYSRVGYRYYEKIIYENGAFLAGDDDWLFNVKDSCAVCGNIYENPELLEQADEN